MKTQKPKLSAMALLCLSLCMTVSAQAGTCETGGINPDTDYINNGDGTVTHNPTGLIWKRCLEGQTYSSNGSCAGTPTAMNWVNALKLSTTATFASQSDWRLPNIKELRSLVEECRTNPSINSNLFPNTPSVSHNVWSSTPKRTYFTLSDTFVWGVSFDAGGSYNDFSGNNLLVRLVRGGKPLGALGVPVCTISADPPSNVTSGGTVKLTASCSTGTTIYKWSGDTIAAACPTTSSSCTVTPLASTTYTLIGGNASGQSGPATNLSISVAASSTGTYKDTVTGLVWKNCLEGQTWDTTSATCTGTPSVYNFYQASTFNTDPVSYASVSNWRLPTIRELLTLVDDTTIGPATNITTFPNTPAYATVWSSSFGANTGSVAWYAAFNRGNAQLDGLSGSRAVRLVSGPATTTTLSLSSTARPNADYKDLGNGTVTHIPTNLMWQRCLIGQTWDGTTCTGTAGLFTWAQTFQLPTSNNFVSYTDWRLPTQKELLSLVDYTVANPAINSTIFPNNGNSIVWSKTAFVGNASFQWLVSFANGDNLLNLPGDAYSVRLVRGSAVLTTPVSNVPTSMLPLTTTSITDAAQGSTVVSPAITVSGVSVLTPISITNGEYQINGGTWTSLAGAVKNGDVVKVRVTASTYPATTVGATLKIGTLEGTFSVSTPTVVGGTASQIGETYTDPQTGLEWKRCSEGQTWLNGTCTGTASTHSFTDTAPVTKANTAPGFKGKTDWRVPTIRELSTLVDYTVPNAAAKINNTLYPNTPNAMFWTSSSNVLLAGNAWYLYFFDGYANDNEAKTLVKHIRLVRGILAAAVPAVPATSTTPAVPAVPAITVHPGLLNSARSDADYIDWGDGIVTHKPTGLMWQRCLMGQTWSGTTCTGVSSAYSWDNAKTLTSTLIGQTDWRLPTQKELLSLVDFAKTSAPAINTTIFPNDGGSNVWSSTAFVDDSTHAMYVALNNGASYHQARTNNLSVRLVRNGLLSDTNCLFNWAERLLPEFLSPPNQATQQILQMEGNAIYHRHYPSTGVYIATNSTNLYAIGGALGNQLLTVGLITDFLPAAIAASCR